MEWTGGCLCGAVRYRATKAPKWASYCHCSMCRKATGAPFAGFVEFPENSFEWTKGQSSQYQSSNGVIRRFCGKCGSSLTFESDAAMFISQGSLDAPEAIKFNCHTYTETRLPNMELADGLPQFPGPVGGKGGRSID